MREANEERLCKALEEIARQLTTIARALTTTNEFGEGPAEAIGGKVKKGQG